MKRNDLITQINQIFNEILNELKKQSLIQNIEDYELVEMYQELPIMGILSFEYVFNNSIKVNCSKQQLSQAINKIIEDSDKRYLFMSITNIEQSYLSSIRLTVNYEKIDIYLTDFIDLIFNNLGFESFDDFKAKHNLPGFSRLFNNKSNSIKIYVLTDEQTKLLLKVRSVSLFSAVREIEKFYRKSDKFKQSKNLATYSYTSNNKLYLVTFKQSSESYEVAWDVKIYEDKSEAIDNVQEMTDEAGDKGILFKMTNKFIKK